MPFFEGGGEMGGEQRGGEGRSRAAQRTDGRSQLGRQDTKKWWWESERKKVRFRSFPFFWQLAAREWIFVEESGEDARGAGPGCAVRWKGEEGVLPSQSSRCRQPAETPEIVRVRSRCVTFFNFSPTGSSRWTLSRRYLLLGSACEWHTELPLQGLVLRVCEWRRCPSTNWQTWRKNCGYWRTSTWCTSARLPSVCRWRFYLLLLFLLLLLFALLPPPVCALTEGSDLLTCRFFLSVVLIDA